MAREQNLQSVAWLLDHYRRNQLELDPPYQRRSVWNQSYKDHFIDTILLNYPAPAIFLYEDLSPEGVAKYSVVDGKQRLTSIFEFVNNEFPVSDAADATAYRGKYFQDFLDDQKREFFGYRFLIEYLPGSDEGVINNVFNRINKNVAKLTAQELRHAKFEGAFISTCERLADWMVELLGNKFPRIATTSRKQMKDVELVAHILLCIEENPASYSQDDLDKAFSDRDSDWPQNIQVESEFRHAIGYCRDMILLEGGDQLSASRFQNQADFYSLIGAIQRLVENERLPEPVVTLPRLVSFAERLADEELRIDDAVLTKYFEDARSASNDKGPRERRIETVAQVISSDE